ncbi:hypothetical protein GCM10025881_24320 [Pseudolysinimonas kribbensis]|uniref:DUF427 domain-containing protein n=1 Tax=Pseudolysinimonas kribbensis TaxID=433641 RepID=A0ABQ6K4Q7_9MICO|nr:hypothetical protein GCM10025881_24320 [Pseudolysinimonas kribbensis]
MATATLNGTVIAEAPAEDIIHIEGNAYFPPSSVKAEFLENSPTPTPARGRASASTSR